MHTLRSFLRFIFYKVLFNHISRYELKFEINLPVPNSTGQVSRTDLLIRGNVRAVLLTCSVHKVYNN